MTNSEFTTFIDELRAWVHDHAPPTVAAVDIRARHYPRPIRILAGVPTGLHQRLMLILKMISLHQIHGPLRGRQIAEMCKRKYDSALRADLAELLVAEHLIRTEAGYRMPDGWRKRFTVVTDARQ